VELRVNEGRYTDGEYLARHPQWHREHSAWKARQIATLLARNGPAPRSVAEVGCGAGGILAALQQAWPETSAFTGYDIAADALQLAAPLANDRLRFVLGDFVALAPARVDLLLAIDVVEHVEDYLGFLRALRPRAARHVFHLPLDLSLVSSLQPHRLAWAFEGVGHLHYFTAETARRALLNAGYRVTDAMFTSIELDEPAAVPGQQHRLQLLRRMGRRLSPAWTSRLLGGFSLLALCE
jgi:SAM-dependent methyltransferase